VVVPRNLFPDFYRCVHRHRHLLFPMRVPGLPVSTCFANAVACFVRKQMCLLQIPVLRHIVGVVQDQPLFLQSSHRRLVKHHHLLHFTRYDIIRFFAGFRMPDVCFTLFLECFFSSTLQQFCCSSSGSHWCVACFHPFPSPPLSGLPITILLPVNFVCYLLILKRFVHRVWL
jgi:hypothetical protein